MKPDVFEEEDDANAELEGPRDGNDTEIRHQNKQKRMSWVLVSGSFFIYYTFTNCPTSASPIYLAQVLYP